MRKKIWTWVKVISLLISGLFVILMITFLAFLISSTISDKEAIVDSVHINRLALILGGLSLPGVLISFTSLVDLNSKKKFIVTMPCPKCKHLVDIKLIEE
ncbi:hypothetical protein [Paenibacillus radicis (ex Xue et al. 2023)]|uniref:Uncharacterized protein n=1 Tax=Paenibacillus radicis (ex Xue et al. 2023) TaxID=2972489 RepID=A0ABT1YJV5_9BACL|nr:hypothetical protein [Paenibacillus radicis (ex Xue et al. 2023)]MCR8633475.1 hypothetical protein [Paenibacillus radicis (ex Xue et al. 2023)]